MIEDFFNSDCLQTLYAISSFESYPIKKVGFSIAPANANSIAKKYADYITERSGGDRAVAEACIYILEKFFEPFNPDILPESNTNKKWTV